MGGGTKGNKEEQRGPRACLCRDTRVGQHEEYPDVLWLRKEGTRAQKLQVDLKKGEGEDMGDQEKGFRRDNVSATSFTRTKTKKTTGVINQAVEEETSSEEEEDEDEKGAVYTKACIEPLMTLGQGHIDVNVGLEDCDSVSGYGFMEAPAGSDSDDAGEWKVQGRGGTSPLKKSGAVKKEQVVALGVTSENEKPAKPAWVEESTRRVIPKKKDSFVKAIQDKVGRLRKIKVYVPVKTPSVISRSAKVATGGTFA